MEEANKCLAEGPKFEIQEPYVLDEAQSWQCLFCPKAWHLSEEDPTAAAKAAVAAEAAKAAAAEGGGGDDDKSPEKSEGARLGKPEYMQHVREKHSGMVYKCHICSLGVKEKRKLAQVKQRTFQRYKRPLEYGSQLTTFSVTFDIFSWSFITV